MGKQTAQAKEVYYVIKLMIIMHILGCLAEEIKEKYNTEEEGYRVGELFFFVKVDMYRHYVTHKI